MSASAGCQVEAALRQSEERLTTVIEHLAEGLVISKLDGQILHWNRAALEMHEFRSLEEGRRALPEFQKIFELASLDGRMLPLDEWPISRIFRGEVLKDVEVRIRKVTNNWQRILSYGGMLITDRTGERLAIVTILDITDRKRAEEAIRESSEFNRQIMMGAREGLVVLDRELRYQVFNPAMEEITGWRADNIVGRCLHELFPPEQIADGIARVRRALAGETLPTMDVFMPHANRPHPIWVSSTLSPLRNVRGEIIGVIGVDGVASLGFFFAGAANGRTLFGSSLYSCAAWGGLALQAFGALFVANVVIAWTSAPVDAPPPSFSIGVRSAIPAFARARIASG